MHGQAQNLRGATLQETQTLDFYYLVSILSHCQRENVKTFGLILKLKLKINSLLTS